MLNNLTTDERLALVSARDEKWRIELLSNPSEVPAGTLDGVTGGSFDQSVFAKIRTSGSLSYESENPINWMDYRVQPWYSILDDDGEVLLEWPVGVFIASTPGKTYSETAVQMDIELYDKLFILDQDMISETWTYDTGAVVTTAIRDIIESAGETRISITESDKTLVNPVVWEAGTTKLQMVNDLLKAINYFSLWVDGYGYFRADPYVAPQYRSVDWIFADDEESIYLPNFAHEQDLFNVPNKVVLVARTDGETAPFTSMATNENPDSIWSYQNRGRWIVRFESDVEATSQAILDALAQRRLLELTNAGSVYNIKHALLPLEMNSAVRFRRDEENVSVLAVVQKTSFSMSVGGHASTTLREVVDD